MRFSSLTSLAALAAVTLTGCGLTLDVAEDAGFDAGPSMDSGSGGAPCGPVTCAVGLECCNASCGTCVAPGGSCTDQACFDAGDARDAGGDAGHDAGGRDGGLACGSVTCGEGQLCCPGCGTDRFCSSGTDCPIPTCPPTCDDGVACPDTDYCAHAPGMCAGPSTCTPRPTACPSDCPGVCGCDGLTHCNECEANAAGTTVASNAPCAPPTRACGAMDVVSEGDCLVVLGYAWNGFTCSQIDCICRGTQCGELFLSQAACLATYAMCECGGFLGRPCPMGTYCDYPPDTLCGAADATGACHPRPTGCADIDAPVCGCDGMDYSNDCYAAAAGVSVAHEGRCTAPSPGAP